MMQSEVKQFFNQMADGWDEKEVKDSKWLTDFFLTYVPISNGMNVLDLGCGTGIVSSIISKMSHTKVVALDVSDSMIDIAKEKHTNLDIDFFTEDFYTSDYTGFDMIVCFNAYPHFVNIDAFKEQAKKTLNTNGYLVILHSLSREELTVCHQGLSSNLSRNLDTVEIEASHYQSDFKTIELIDNNEMFMMLLQKR